MLKRIRDDERGVTIIIAILVTFIVMMLSLAIINLSIHNTGQSAYDRKRVQSVNASEAGVDYTWNTIEQTAPDLLAWSNVTHTGTYSGALGSAPGNATFTATVTYFDANQTQMTTQPSQSNPPAYALISSRGQTNGTVDRTIQSYVKLTPIRQGIQSAVLINSGASFTNNFTINGDQGNDGDVHIEDGDLTISNQPNIYGNVYVSGSTCTTANAATCGRLTIQNNNTIHGNAWAWGAVDIRNPAAILGNVQSSASTVGTTGTVGGDATAGSTISASLHVTGSKYANSPSTQHPPAVTFPLVCWETTGTCSGARTEYQTQDVKNNSTGAGSVSSPQPDGTPDWTIVPKTDCATARSFLTSATITRDTVLRVTNCSNLQINNNESVNFQRNLVIFTDGSITMNNQNNWNGQNNNTLAFVVNYQALPQPCSNNITTSNNSNFNNVYVSFYSPCTVTIQNQNTFSGQVIGQTVNLANNFTLNYKPVLLPGLGRIIGFRQDVVYIREVA